jgi:hypothetical protein
MSEIVTMKEQPRQLLIHYRHYDCPVNPDIEWFDIWESAVDGVCPACGMENIVPVEWNEIHQ